MFQKVVIPLDGSELAESVLPYVQQIASPLGAELILVRNIESSAYTFAADSSMAAARLLESMHQEIEKYLVRHREELERSGYRVQTEIARGDIASAIVRVATDHGADLIAMTTHGRSGVPRAVLGSVADRVVRSAHLPVLLIRAAAAEPTVETIREILVPLDGSELSEQALPFANGLAQKIGGRILLLRVVEELADADIFEIFEQSADGPSEMADLFDEAQSYLDRIQKKLSFSNITSKPQVVVAHPAQAILDAAAIDECDLIVMSTHGRSGIRRWVYGSIASKVLHGTECPLLLVRGHVREEVPEMILQHVAEAELAD